MRRTSLENALCPIARSLDTIGEWWSLLIVNAAMHGVRRFSDFQRRLGLARNILSARLKRLVEREILQIVPASDGTAYQEYVLTEKGKYRWPVLTAMRQWGEQYLFQPGEERTELLDKKYHKVLAQMQVQGTDGETRGFDDVDLVQIKVARGKRSKRGSAFVRAPKIIC